MNNTDLMTADIFPMLGKIKASQFSLMEMELYRQMLKFTARKF